MRIKSSVFAYLLAGISSCILLIGSATAGPDAKPAAKKKVLSIPAAAFTEEQWVSDWNISRKGGLLLSLPTNTSQGVGNFHAPVILPHNARVYELRLISKNDDTPAIQLQLMRHTTSGGQKIDTLIMGVDNPPFSPGYSTRSISLRGPYKVNNDGACYSLQLYLPDAEGNDVAFHHAEIIYKGKW